MMELQTPPLVKDEIRTEKTTETRECDRHGEFLATITTRYAGTKVWLQPWISSCPVCEEERTARIAREEAEDQQRKRRERIWENRKNATIPARFKECTFDNYVAKADKQKRALSDAKAFAEHFETVQKSGDSLVFCGKPGCGKTHLACAIANHLLGSERKVKYSTVAEVIREIRATWRRDSIEGESSVIAKYQKVELLILDEVGGSFGGEAEEKPLFDVLDGRYREMHPTVIVSNLDNQGPKDSLGPRLYDRITAVGSSVVVFNWESHRQAMRGMEHSGTV